MLRTSLTLLPLIFFIAFFAYPLFKILIYSFTSSEDIAIYQFAEILTDPYYLGRIWFTVWQAFLSMILALLAGLPIAYIFSKYEFTGKSFLQALTTVPFVMPTIVVAMGFITLFGNDGILNTGLSKFLNLNEPLIKINNSLTIILIAHTFYNYSIIVRIVSSIWANIDPELERAGSILGANKFHVFTKITLPVLLPAIISSALLAFTFSFSSFGVILVLAGPKFATIEVSIYQLAVKLMDLPSASTLCIIQIIFTYSFMILYSNLQNRYSNWINIRPSKNTYKLKKTKKDNIFIILGVIYILILISPLIALIARTLSFEIGNTQSHVSELFSNQQGSYFYLNPITTIINSFKFAAGTLFISIILGTISSYLVANRTNRSKNHLIDALLMLPLGVSSIALGLGYILAWNTPPFDLRGSWIIIIIAHSLIAYPFVMRSVLPAIQQINPNLREVATLLGSSTKKVFYKIDLPLITPSLIVGSTFAFAISIGEFGASLLLVKPEFTTMPVAIYRFLGLPGDENLKNALVMSSILMCTVIIGFICIEKLRYKNIGTF
ncbi:MAG: iron ABC transporter permease [SAR202 cluster bacterium]|mgnify:FL=1|nr:iron ABC transporter permease [SAR202 cluster bacterium]|tara:strand:+ start:40189 stop:41844 length:1656 start_codon:yes stop_codon:yes gene_type:complete